MEFNGGKNMKKLGLLILLIFFIASPVFACGECDSHTNINTSITDGNYSNSYIPPIDAPGCPNVCQDLPGALDYDGKSLSIFNYVTGEGYDCRKPRNNGYAVFPVCFCDKVNELEKDHEYGLVLEILTPGAAWYSQASITPEYIAVRSFPDETRICEDREPSNVTYLSYLYDNDRKTVIVTDTSANMLTNDLYLGVSIPPIVADQSVIPEGTVIKVRITLYDGELVCAPYCTEPLCNCTIPVAVMACWNDCCNVLPYFALGEGWWTGLAITNLSDHDGSVSVTYMQGDKLQMRVYKVKAREVKTIYVNGEDLPFTNCWAQANSGFSMRTFVIMGDGNQAYGYIGTTCSPCGD
jgi:hypothetical protein